MLTTAAVTSCGPRHVTTWRHRRRLITIGRHPLYTALGHRQAGGVAGEALALGSGLGRLLARRPIGTGAVEAVGAVEATGTARVGMVAQVAQVVAGGSQG